jgi:CO dehydrogenase nickel-insertion accessory protein CooC1
VALGLGPDTALVRSIRNELDEHHHGEASRQHDLGKLIDDLAVRAPDGIRLVQIGTIERPSAGCLCCGSHSTLRDVFERIAPEPGEVVVTDLEAGANDLVWARPGAEDTLLVVTDAGRKSLEVASRLLHIAGELGVGRVLLVVNRLKGGEMERITEELAGVETVGIPEDDEILDADRRGASVLDAAPQGAAVGAIRQLALRLQPPSA